MDTKILILFTFVLLSSFPVVKAKEPKPKAEQTHILEKWRQTFKEHGIQPDVLRKIPEHLVKIKTKPDGKLIETASTHSISELREMPTFEWDSKKGSIYSLFLLNPDVPNREEPFEAEWQHLVIMNIPESDLKKGEQIIEYSPDYQHAQAAGLQRMVAIVIEQKRKIDTKNMTHFDKKTFRKPDDGESRGDFHIKPYIFEAKLKDSGDGYFANFFYIDARGQNLTTGETLSKDSGDKGSTCKSKNDCQTKFDCINETCQIVASEDNISPKLRSQIKRSDDSKIDEEFVETEPALKDIKFCTTNNDCTDGKICREDYCQDECFVNDDCPNNSFKCEKAKCIKTGEDNKEKNEKSQGKKSKGSSKSVETTLEPKNGQTPSKPTKMATTMGKSMTTEPKKKSKKQSKKSKANVKDSLKKTNNNTIDVDTIPENDEDYEDEGKTNLKIPTLAPQANSRKSGDSEVKGITTTTTTTTRELLVKNVVRIGNNGQALKDNNENEDAQEEETSSDDDANDSQTYEEADTENEDENDEAPKGSNGDDAYTSEDDGSEKSESKKTDGKEEETENEPSVGDEKKDEDKEEDTEGSKEVNKNIESKTILPAKFKGSTQPSFRVQKKKDGPSVSTNSSEDGQDLPDSLLGYYKYPKECDQNSIGNCRFVIKWFKEKHPNEVKFVIIGKGINSTGIGFSLEKNITGSDFIEVDDDDLIVKDKHIELKTLENQLKDINGNSFFKIERKKGVRIDPARNLISAKAEKQGDLLLVEFIRQIQTDDKLYDLHLGQHDGVFFFFTGSSIGKPNRFIFMPKKIHLNHYFDEKLRSQELLKFPRFPEEIFGSTPKQTENDSKNVCSDPTFDGRRFVSSKSSFLTYIVCSAGKAKIKTCPNNALFFYVLQCCVPTFKFPCSENCIHDN